MSHFCLVFLLYLLSCQSLLAQLPQRKTNVSKIAYTNLVVDSVASIQRPGLSTNIGSGKRASKSASPAGDSSWLDLLPSFPAYAKSRHPKFRRLTPNEGLSQGHVTSILKDNEGFMWFATDEGLNKYDGYTFTIYKNDPEKPGSISNNFVRNVTKDHVGNVWVATTSGLDKFDRQQDGFVHYTPTGKSIYIEDIFQDRQKRMWIGSNEGLYLFHPGPGTFQHYPHKEKDTNSLSHNNIYQITEDSEGDLWIGTQDGLNRFNPQTQQFIHYRHDPQNRGSIGSNWVTSVYRDSKGRIWAGTLGGGIALFDRKKNSFINFLHDPKNHNSVAHNDILSLVESNDGKLWIGTENGGLSVFDYEKNSFVTYVNDASDNSSLSNNSVHSLYKDDIGNIWAGTWSGGVNFLPLFGDKFAHYKRVADNSNSLSHNIVTTITGDEDGNIWMGTDGGGLNLLDRNKKTILHYRNDPSNPKSIKSDYIISTTAVSADVLALAYHRVGFDLLNRKTGVITHLPEDTEDKDGALLANTSGTIVHKDLWMGTYYNFGLFYYNRATKRFTRYQHNPLDTNSIGDGWIMSLLEDRDGNVWIGMGLNSGVDFFDRKNNRFIHHLHDPKNNHSISNNIVLSIMEDRQGNVWLGTGNGLNCFDKKTKRFRSYTEKDGLANNVIYGILEDRHGNLWISSNKGISKFNPVTKECRNYDVSDGLQDNTFKVQAWYQTAQGEMFFGGINGFNVFHPDSVRDNPFVPPVWITDLQIFNKSVGIGKGSPLSQHITETKEVTLSYQQSVFTFAFAALNYTLPEKNQYAYKLEGFDKDWSYVGTKRTATYTNLDAGDYTFLVKGSNNDGVWNEHGTSLIVHILPPWWKTLWFRISVILIVLSGAIVYYKMRINKITSQKVLLEKEVAIRTTELREANFDLKTTNEKVNAQKEEIETQSDALKNLYLELNSSIRAAESIQQTILTSATYIKDYFPESFIFYRPKDVVSGDFYWFNVVNDAIVLAAVDCTGHGVSGAIMSIHAYHLLNLAVYALDTVSPDEVLERLNKIVYREFTQNESETEKSPSGMDISICVIDKEKQSLQFSGATIPVYVLRDKEIIQIKGSKYPIGLINPDGRKMFSKHEVELRKGDKVYLFSDGYSDQFGGENGDEKFKYFRFRDLIVSMSNTRMQDQASVLEETLNQWKGKLDQIDDILVIGVEI